MCVESEEVTDELTIIDKYSMGPYWYRRSKTFPYEFSKNQGDTMILILAAAEKSPRSLNKISERNMIMQNIIQSLFMIRRIFLLFLLTALLSTNVAAEGVEGSGGGNEGSNESPEGSEGGNASGESGNIPFVSSGLSLGTFESPILNTNETFAGLFSDTEIAINFDQANEKFVGRIRNEGSQPVCDVKVAVIVDGIFVINNTFSGNPLQIDGLLTGGRQDFEFPVPGATLYLQNNPSTSWTVMVETFSCNSAPTTVAGNASSGSNGGECSGSPAGNEGGGSESGNESGGGENGNESGGSESGNQGGIASGDESSPAIPITDSFSGVFQNQNFTFAYDNSTQAFRGTVENITNNFVCLSRTEVHLGVGTQVIELGPTIPENLAPGEILHVVVAIDGITPDTYTLHPESSPCP